MNTSSTLRGAALAAALVLVGCSDDPAGNTPPPPPEPETLFDALPAATPDTLRGVWGAVQEQEAGTIEMRVRFMEDYVVGAAKCTPAGGSASVIAGGSTGLVASDLDASAGTIEFATLGLIATDDAIRCEVTIPGGTYDFAIEDGGLTLTTSTARLAIPFTKVGD